MALKVLLLRKKLNERQDALNGLLQAAEGFAAREAELEIDIGAAQTDEERSAVEEAVTTFEAERSANATRVAELRSEIAGIEQEIAAAEQAAEQARSAPRSGAERTDNQMADIAIRNTRALRMLGETPEQRSALVARDEVKDFLARVRELKGQNRSVTGAELGVPDVLVGILRDNTERYSKLLQYITVKPLKGKARQNIAGAVPEGIWTEAIGTLNELDIVFTQVEMDGYKVGGYLAIPNSDLEDDDNLQLTATILDYLGQAIGLAVDKAVIYGTGEKMPVGFVTRLAATAKPNWWGSHQGDFIDLHSSNMLKLDIAGQTGASFFQPLLAALGVAKPNYSTGEPVWVMNRKTHMDIVCKALSFDAAGALVAGMNGKMPVIGGNIVELEFMSDYDVAGGYLSLELWAERSGSNIASSDIPLFIQDMTVFKGTQRYDGKPVRGEAFVAVNYNNTAPATAKSFLPDYANNEIGTLIVVSAAGTTTGKSKITVSGADAGAALKYQLGPQNIAVTNGQKIGSNWSALTSGAEVTATTGSIITVAQVDDSGKAVRTGFAIVTAAT